MHYSEKHHREALAGAHHIIHYYGWDDLLATHISLRIPETDHVLITPLNVPFEAISASKLVKCDLDGNIIASNGYHVLPQATNIHCEIYKSTDQIGAAVHTHSVNGVAVSTLECGLLFNHQQALRFYGDVAYHDFEGLALENEGAEIVKSLQDKKVMILKNHGLLSTGHSIADAIYQHYYLEQCCQIQLKLLATGQSWHALPSDVCQKTKKQFDSIRSVEKEFDTLLNRVDGCFATDFRT